MYPSRVSLVWRLHSARLAAVNPAPGQSSHMLQPINIQYVIRLRQ